MASIRQVYENVSKVNFETVVSETIKSKEDDMIFLNVNQMQEGEGADNRELRNTNKNYKGVYKPLTSEIAEQSNTVLPKRVGELYNFGWTGEFLSNFKMDVDKKQYNIFSTGTGGDGKKSFFDGFKNLYGLNKESRQKLVEEKGLRKALITNYGKATKLL